jgi:hypothetical protein
MLNNGAVGIRGLVFAVGVGLLLGLAWPGEARAQTAPAATSADLPAIALTAADEVVSLDGRSRYWIDGTAA